VAIVLGSAAALAAAALGLAAALDNPTGGRSTRDPSQPIVAGPVVAPGQELTGGQSNLPPLRLVLDRPPPGNIARLSAAKQIPRLRALADRTGGASALVQLGSAQQAVGENADALRSYREALRREPNDLSARVGVLMVDGAGGTAGLGRAARALQTLAREHPRSQVVLFNQGWVAAYRRDARQAVVSWGRTAMIDRATPLGQAARQLVTAIARSQGGNP
jgi:hypothetical protein